MGISKQQAAHNREAIIQGAEKLFREKGVDAVGLNDLMDAAGFTRGGFYNHFKSKDALVTAVMEKAMRDGAATVTAIISGSCRKGRDPLDSQIARYLSPEHRADIESGCPVSGFAGDVPRMDEQARKQYALGLEGILEQITTLVAALGQGPAEARARAIEVFSEMVGTLLLSRAVAAANPALSDEILAAGRTALRPASKGHRTRAAQTARAVS